MLQTFPLPSRPKRVLRVTMILALPLIFLVTCAGDQSGKTPVAKKPEAAPITCGSAVPPTTRPITFGDPTVFTQNYRDFVVCQGDTISWEYVDAHGKHLGAFAVDFVSDDTPFNAGTPPLFSPDGSAISCQTKKLSTGINIASYKYNLFVNGRRTLDPHVIVLGTGSGIEENVATQ